jgi:hypothetical protein
MIARVLTVSLKITFTLALTIMLTKWAMNTGPITWILQTDRGMDLYYWLLASFGLMGMEQGEDMLITISLCVMLIFSSIACQAVTLLMRRLTRAFVKHSAN